MTASPQKPKKTMQNQCFTKGKPPKTKKDTAKPKKTKKTKKNNIFAIYPGLPCLGVDRLRKNCFF